MGIFLKRYMWFLVTFRMISVLTIPTCLYKFLYTNNITRYNTSCIFDNLKTHKQVFIFQKFLALQCNFSLKEDFIYSI